MQHWRRRTAGLMLFFLASSCERPEEQAVRHAVIAELIERYRVEEEQVRVLDVESAGGGWVVRASVSAGGRAGTTRWLTCRVERSASAAPREAKWKVTTREDDGKEQ